MTTDITIPPEALRAAARALHDASGTADCWDSMWDEMARAACIAMLSAWPDMVEQFFPNSPLRPPGIFLPFTEPRSSEEYASESGDCGGC